MYVPSPRKPWCYNALQLRVVCSDYCRSFLVVERGCRATSQKHVWVVNVLGQPQGLHETLRNVQRFKSFHITSLERLPQYCQKCLPEGDVLLQLSL